MASWTAASSTSRASNRRTSRFTARFEKTNRGAARRKIIDISDRLEFGGIRGRGDRINGAPWRRETKAFMVRVASRRVNPAARKLSTDPAIEDTVECAAA